jgi:putative transposase
MAQDLRRQPDAEGRTARHHPIESGRCGAAAVPDLLRREFTVPMPGLKLIGGITYLATGGGRLYPATTVDLRSKEVIGYAIAPYMRASLAVEAITAAAR